MTPLTQMTDTVFSFVRKMFSFENGALLISALIPAGGLKQLFNTLFQGIEMKDYAMPMVVAFVGLSLYFITYLTDFITGIKASRFEQNKEPGWFKSDKGWSSIWKISIIYLVTFSLTIFSLLCLIIGMEWLHSFFIYSILVWCIMATLLDLHSIGENYKRRFGKKAAIFTWLDDVYAALNESIIKKIKNLV